MEQKISFHFQPFNIENKEHVVEKSEGGMKRRYLRGVSSGVQADGHGEFMTVNCIKSFTEQANSGDILLYPDLHGVQFTNDVGILKSHEVLGNGDWMTEYRLYDESDKIGANTVERADKLWRQINGLPPYTKPRQKGFSIEGHIPDDGIVHMNQDGTGRVMDKVILDGVVVVPRPAYKDSVAHAVYKALGIESPWIVEKSINNFFAEVEKDLTTYMYGRFSLEDALYKAIDYCVTKTDINIENIKKALGLYTEHMIKLVQNSTDLFKSGSFRDLTNLPINTVKKEDKSGKSTKSQLFKQLSQEMVKLEKSIRSK